MASSARLRSWLGSTRVPASLGVTMEPVPAAVSEYRRHSLYTPELQLMAETEITTSAVPAIAWEYVWFGGQPVAQIASATGAIEWTFTDHLGTPLLQTDAAAQITWRAEYEPYGTIHTLRVGTGKHQPLRFPGQEAEEGGGEVAYNIFRWYRSSWGRYAQADSTGLQGGSNLYAYSMGNPLSFSDRLGLVTWQCRVGTVVKAGEFLGGGAVTISCTSKSCINGRQRFVQAAGLAGGVTIGAPVGVTFYDLELTDDSTVPLAENLAGYFSIHALGASLFYGYTVEVEIVAGKASGRSSGKGWGGVGAGFDNFWGLTTVILDMETCCTE